jgi:hypothetical protein
MKKNTWDDHIFQVFAEVKKKWGNPFNVYFSSYFIFCNISVQYLKLHLFGMIESI